MDWKPAIVIMAAVALGLLLGNSVETGISADNYGSATAKVVGATGKGGGIIGEVTVNIEPGNGKVLIATSPYVKANTQASAKLAKNVAEAYTDTELDDKNVVYSFNVSSGVIGGPSAGAAMTLATIAAIKDDVEVRKDAVITGTITRRGRIGKVGKVMTKARAAGSSGLEYFYVPEGQSTRVNYRPVVDREFRGLFVYRDVEYRREVFDISNYTERRFDMRTHEVGTLSSAAELMLKG
ncbi:MAG: S16 family serine protease [Candidatus Nanohalobium sp.]